MNLRNSVNKFYFDMTINELRRMTDSNIYPNLTYNSLLYLDIIAYTENCTVTYLADALNVAKSAVTLKMNELLSKGFVKKEQSKKDKRINYLSVNPEVVKEYKAYDEKLYRVLDKVEERFSPNEINAFCNILDYISESLKEENKNE